MKDRLEKCKICGKHTAKVESWKSGGMMYMVKCGNENCPVPKNGYPTGRNLKEVMEKWNKENKEEQK